MPPDLPDRPGPEPLTLPARVAAAPRLFVRPDPRGVTLTDRSPWRRWVTLVAGTLLLAGTLLSAAAVYAVLSAAPAGPGHPGPPAPRTPGPPHPAALLGVAVVGVWLLGTAATWLLLQTALGRLRHFGLRLSFGRTGEPRLRRTRYVAGLPLPGGRFAPAPGGWTVRPALAPPVAPPAVSGLGLLLALFGGPLGWVVYFAAVVQRLRDNRRVQDAKGDAVHVEFVDERGEPLVRVVTTDEAAVLRFLTAADRHAADR